MGAPVPPVPLQPTLRVVSLHFWTEMVPIAAI
jgi:hypothetical protein